MSQTRSKWKESVGRLAAHPAEGVLVLLAILLFAAVAGVTLRLSLYGILTTDDYWLQHGMGGLHRSFAEHWGQSVAHAALMMQTWQGTWLSMFLQVFINPLNLSETPHRILHLELFVVDVFFYVSLWALFRAALRRRGYRVGWLPFVALSLVTGALASYAVYPTNFFWFTGMAHYMIPFILGLWSITCCLLAEEKKVSTRGRIALQGTAAVCGLLACGGSLQVAGVTCYLLLLLVVLSACRKEKIFSRGAVFLAAFAGSLSNALAPGNFARKGVMGNTLSLTRAIKDTLFTLLDEGDKLFNGSALPVILLLAVLAGMLLARRREEDAAQTIPSWVLLLLALPLPAVAAFPVLLGYGTRGLPGWTQLVFHLTMGTWVLAAGFCAGAGIMRHALQNGWEEKQARAIFVPVLLLLCLVQIGANNLCLRPVSEDEPLRQMALSRAAFELSDGQVQAYYQEVVEITDAIRFAPEEEVHIPSLPREIYALRDFVLSDTAAYYGKTVVVDG